jgi:hypothetical protein
METKRGLLSRQRHDGVLNFFDRVRGSLHPLIFFLRLARVLNNFTNA